MTKLAGIHEFLKQKNLAVVGVSRSNKKFANMVYKSLKAKGYNVFAVNPHTTSIEGEACFADLHSLPQQVEGVVIVVKPEQTEKVVRDAAACGIKHVWLQQGAESQAAIDFCKQQGINVIHKQCVLMFAEPAGFPHRLHRRVRRVFGKLPK